MKIIQRDEFSGVTQPHLIYDNPGEIFQAVAIGPQSQIDQVFVWGETVGDPLDKTLWTPVAGFNGDNFRRDRFIRGGYLVSVERPLIAPIKAPIYVADRFWPNRINTDGDRAGIKDNHTLYSAQVAGSVGYFPTGAAGGIPQMRQLGLELELHTKCPPWLPTRRPPAVAVAEVNDGGSEWAGASEQVVCAIASLGRGAAEFSIALDNPGTGTYILNFYGINYLQADQGLVESSNFTQLLGTVTYTTDNVFEVYNYVGHFDAYAICGRNSAGADTARGVFMIKVRDVE